MIVNIPVSCFGGPLRNGDLIGVVNVICHLRKTVNPNIKFNMLSDAVSPSGHCQLFYNFLLETTDFFTRESGESVLSWQKVNLWDYRDISGDVVSIPNTIPQKKKIVVFPLFDAPYNTYRNWSIELLNNIVEKYSVSEYDSYEKIICIAGDLNMAYTGWNYSTDFITNVNHIRDAEIFVGGETGMSIYASALDNSPTELVYYYSSRALIHTTPFHIFNGKGKMKTYWLDFEGTRWQ